MREIKSYMKKNIFYTLMAVYSSLAFGQDSAKINKSHFSFQTGLSNYNFNFNGLYMSGGYRYTINKYMLLASDITLSSGTKNTHSIYYTPHYEFRGIALGSQFQIAFLKRHTIRAGVAVTASTLALSDIASKFYYAPYNRDIEAVYFIRKYSIGWQYSLTYMCRVSNRLRTGINFSQAALELFNKYTTNLNLYGVNLELSF